MNEIPQDKLPDSTLSLAKEGYLFISNRCKRYNSDLFQTRLLLNKTICMQGHEAARLFYDTTRFSRSGVAPKIVKATLFGEGGVQGLDDENHLHRKNLFMNLMTRERITELSEEMQLQLEIYAQKWETVDQVVLFDELQEIIFRAVCTWCGIPLKESETKMRANDFGAMIDGAGSVGSRFMKGVYGRKRSEKWLEELIQQVRNQELSLPKSSPLYSFASHKDLNGELLDKNISAVELINVVRPTVAVARFITFSALAMHIHPEYRERLEQGDDKFLLFFSHEVRRFYPFFPFVTARTKKSFEWNGYSFPADTQVLLDLYGTNHDRRLWENPDQFYPDRFKEWDENSFNFIPQGGGDYYQNHRCAGEWITIELIKKGVQFLVHNLQYDVPKQNLNVDLSRMPAIPESRFIIHVNSG